VSYKIGFDGPVTAELEKLLRSIEKGVNGFGIHGQTSDTAGASVTASGSTTPPCPAGQPCSDSVKGGHDVVVLAIAIVGGAAAGYVAGKLAARRYIESVKGGHD
jgi:hypothetical protein